MTVCGYPHEPSKMATTDSLPFPTCVICGTVATGLEMVAGRECREKLKCKVRETRGRIYFEIPEQDFHKIDLLRAVENVFVVVKEFDKVQFLFGEEETALKSIYDLLKEIEESKWSRSIELWKIYSGFKGNVPLYITSQPDDFTNHDKVTENSSDSEKQIKRMKTNGDVDRVSEILVDSEMVEENIELQISENTSTDNISHDPEPVSNDPNLVKVANDNNIIPNSEVQTHINLQTANKDPSQGKDLPKFRVTCMRSGSGHKFRSQEGAAHFGGAIHDAFGWRVDLSNADIDVLLNIVDNKIVVGIALSRDSLHKRNISHFGPTSLKSTVAYCLLKLANIKPGDVVCDPMCGSGVIPLEASVCWPDAVHICGDNHELAPPRTKMNLHDHKQRDKIGLDIFQWDVCNLPLRTGIVDSIITDLPFGKKSGSKHKNWELYPKALEEMARVCQPKTSRAILLTYDKKVMAKILKMTPFWKNKFTYWVNVGGLNVGAYVLQRTAREYLSKKTETDGDSDVKQVTTETSSDIQHVE